MYIRINDKKFTAEELAEKLGIGEHIEKISLCVDIPSGELEASSFSDNNDLYPGIDTQIKLKTDDLPILVTRTEQARNSDPMSYLYGRTDTYLAYMRHDVRPDDEFDAEPRNPVLIVGGDSDFDVQLYTENNFVHWCGSVRDDQVGE